LFRAADDYRVPGQCYARPDQLSERGVEGAVLVVDPDTRTPEVFVRRGDRMVLSAAAHLSSLGVQLEATDGPTLPITWKGGSAGV